MDFVPARCGVGSAAFHPYDPEDAIPMADDSAHLDVLNTTAQGQLKSVIERIERLEQEKAEVSEQI